MNDDKINLGGYICKECAYLNDISRSNRPNICNYSTCVSHLCTEFKKCRRCNHKYEGKYKNHFEICPEANLKIIHFLYEGERLYH